MLVVGIKQMERIEYFDFKVPKYWHKHSNGSSCYPSDIRDIFSETFDSYFYFQHPIILDVIQEPDKDFEYLPSFHRSPKLISFQELQSKYYPENPKFRTFTDYVLNNFKGHGLPDEIFGSIKGSEAIINEIKPIIDILLEGKDSNVIIQYDFLRCIIDRNNEFTEEFFYTSISEICSIKNMKTPNYILDIDKQWCISTPYDHYLTLIGCKSHFSKRLINKEYLDIYEILDFQCPE